jgi:transposase
MTAKLWTPEEVETLRDLRCVKGWANSQIAKAMGRSKNSVQKKCEQLGLELPSHIWRGRSFTSVEGNDAILREAFANGTPVSDVAKGLGIYERTVRDAFDRYIAERVSEPKQAFNFGTYIGAREMERIVSDVLGVPVRMIYGQCRLREAVLARMAIARALRDRGLALTIIAKAIGRGDHSTVGNLLRNFDAYARLHEELGWAYDAIKQAEAKASERLAA